VIDRVLAIRLVVDLLWDGADRARDVLARADVRMTRETYLSLQRSIFRREVFAGSSPGR